MTAPVTVILHKTSSLVNEEHQIVKRFAKRGVQMLVRIPEMYEIAVANAYDEMTQPPIDKIRRTIADGIVFMQLPTARVSGKEKNMSTRKVF